VQCLWRRVPETSSRFNLLRVWSIWILRLPTMPIRSEIRSSRRTNCRSGGPKWDFTVWRRGARIILAVDYAKPRGEIWNKISLRTRTRIPKTTTKKHPYSWPMPDLHQHDRMYDSLKFSLPISRFSVRLCKCILSMSKSSVSGSVNFSSSSFPIRLGRRHHPL